MFWVLLMSAWGMSMGTKGRKFFADFVDFSSHIRLISLTKLHDALISINNAHLTHFHVTPHHHPFRTLLSSPIIFPPVNIKRKSLCFVNFLAAWIVYKAKGSEKSILNVNKRRKISGNFHEWKIFKNRIQYRLRSGQHQLHSMSLSFSLLIDCLHFGLDRSTHAGQKMFSESFSSRV